VAGNGRVLRSKLFVKVGIVGYPGVGKSAVFAALTGSDGADASGGRRLAVAEVADKRLDVLRQAFAPKKFTRARFEVEDGLVLPSSSGRGSGEAISALREPDALIVTVGIFEQALMVLDEPFHEPAAQLQSFLDELLLLDLEALEGRVGRLRERLDRGAGDRAESERELAFLERLIVLVEGRQVPADRTDRTHARILAELGLLTEKPVIPVLNVDESDLSRHAESREWAGSNGLGEVLSAPVESEISLLDDEDRRAFLADYGLESPASVRLTRLAYEALDLISFFTVGDDEVRAWPIARGSTAVEAAGKIHTDLARGFIRAEATAFEDVSHVKDGREFKAAAATELRGKDYVVEDGDILNIRFSI